MCKVSVLMTVYNKEKPDYIKKSIDSILRQTFTDFEFIIVDFSNDNDIGNLISHYTDARILYKKPEADAEKVDVLNNFLENARGEYIAIMQSDSISLKNRLAEEVHILDTIKNVGSVNSYAVFIGNNSYRINMPELNQDNLKLILKYMGCCVVLPSVMFRKSIINDNHCRYDSSFPLTKEYKLLIDLIPHCDFYTIPEVLTLYNNEETAPLSFYYRQNSIKEQLVILLKNYIQDLNLNPVMFDTLANKLLNGKFLYKDYLKIKNAVYDPLLEKVKESVSNRVYCSFKRKLKLTINKFNPNKKDDYGVRVWNVI